MRGFQRRPTKYFHSDCFGIGNDLRSQAQYARIQTRMRSLWASIIVCCVEEFVRPVDRIMHSSPYPDCRPVSNYDRAINPGARCSLKAGSKSNEAEPQITASRFPFSIEKISYARLERLFREHVIRRAQLSSIQRALSSSIHLPEMVVV